MTMNQAQLAQIIAQAVAIALQNPTPLKTRKIGVRYDDGKKINHKAVSTYKAANKFTPKGKVDGMSSRQLDNDVKVAKAFKKLGMNVTPRVDVLTYKAWGLKGMTPVKGSKGVFVKGVGTLFHSGQVARSTTFDYLDKPTAQDASASFPA
jgi:hypothetical protein